MSTEPFRIFSGWDSRQAEAADVFAYSVQANASIPVDVQLTSTWANGKILRQGVTEFTYARFLVPWRCGYQGRAAFFDGCDQLCLGDMAELAAINMDGRPLMVVKHDPIRRVPRHGRARSWSSVMLMDCSKLLWWSPEWVATSSDSNLMEFRPLLDDAIGDLPPEWNVLMAIGDAAENGEAKNAKLCHWSYLSDPDGGSWIDRSGSKLWAEWRTRWRDEAAYSY